MNRQARAFLRRPFIRDTAGVLTSVALLAVPVITWLVRA